MKGATCCSGIGAPEEALPEIDWVWSAEIEAFPSAVLAARHPKTVNLGDMLAPGFMASALERGPIDLLVAGTPCQAFSFAGERRSLNDARGALTLKFVEVVHESRARVTLWENVRGVLSTPDNAFGCFLAALVGADDSLEIEGSAWPSAGMVCGPLGRAAWRILDAQYFGLAQRRKRVFLVFCPGTSGIDPAEILFERGRVRGNPPARREEGQDIAGTIGGSSQGGGFRTTDLDNNGAFIPEVSGPCEARESGHGIDGAGYIPEKAYSLKAKGGTGYMDAGRNETFIGVTHALMSEGFDAGYGVGDKSTPIVPAYAPILEVGARTGKSSMDDPRAGIGIGADDDPMFTLQAGKQHAVAFTCKDHGQDAGDVAPSLRSMNNPHSNLSGGGQVAVAFNLRGREGGAMPEATDVATLNAAPGGSSRTYAGVRRLMPVECERLQGFPDGYTDIMFRKKKATDGHRYKALGNSMAVPCIRWIGLRIMEALKK